MFPSVSPDDGTLQCRPLGTCSDRFKNDFKYKIEDGMGDTVCCHHASVRSSINTHL